MADREAVRNNANYLREVRPIDPDEIADYVEGGARPDAVRRVLREEAFDLGLVERDDGTFVPLEPEPVERPEWRPDSFPEQYGVAVEDLLVGRYGPDWHRGASGDRLRGTIDRLKADYLHGNPVTYDGDTAVGYAVYHLPDFYATVGYVLDDLAERDLLGNRLRVLDVGAGVGGPALGLCDYLFGRPGGRDPTAALVEYHAVEPSAAADVLGRLLESTPANFRTRVHRERVEDVDLVDLRRQRGGTAGDRSRPERAPGEPADDGGKSRWDLILFGNVLSELADPAGEVERAVSAVADDGSVVAIAPADLETATGLREVEREVARPGKEATVYSPTLRLWPGEEPTDRGWSFDVGAELSVPPFQRRLDRAARRDATDEPGAYVNVDVQFAYAILRSDGRTRVDIRASPDRHAKLGTAGSYVTERVDLLAVKLSHDLADEGNPVFKVGDGSEELDVYAVVVRETGFNRAVATASYGAVLEFENVLVLWNDDEGAYNLVVDESAAADLIAP